MLIKKRTNCYDFNFHLVWVTKYRKEIFTTKELKDDMKKIIEKISKTNNVTIQNMEIMSDHVHLLISFPPHFTPSSVVKSFKGGSSREWFKLHPETKLLLWNGRLWSGSFFMSTLGSMSKEIVNNYINEQNNKEPKIKKKS